MAKKNQWQPSENFIRNGVGGNYTIALIVSTYHFNALTEHQAEPGIAARLAYFTPFHNTVVNASSAKGAAKGDRISDTATKDELFLDLNQNQMPEIQRLIGNVYIRKTPKWKALFPQGLVPIQKGTIENKLLNLKTLRDKVHADPALSLADAILDPFYTKILNARGDQEGEKSNVGFDIGSQQEAIEKMCVAHFADHGIIISLYPDDPKKIKSFTDWQTLQKKEHGPVYEGTVNPDRLKFAFQAKFKADSQLKVTCDTDITIWVTKSINSPTHPVGIFIPKNTPTIVGFPALGDFANRVVQIQNMDLMTEGHYRIEKL